MLFSMLAVVVLSSHTAPEPQDTAALASKLDVASLTVQALPAPTPGQPGALTLFIDGAFRTMTLTPISTRAVGFVLRKDVSGTIHEEPAPPEASWIAGDPATPGLTGAVNVVAGGVRAMIVMPGGRTFYAQPAREVDATAAVEQCVVYAGDDCKPLPFSCPGGVEVDFERAIAGSARGTGACRREVQIAFDADVLFYNQNGSSVPNTQADIDAVVNGLNLIYARDIGATFATVTTIVRTTAGLYTSTNISTLLTQLKTEWDANQTGIARDVAHLMTGQPTGSTIGLAYTNVMCSTTHAYGLSQSRFSATFSNRVAVTAHELGHNFSASHCDGDADCAIMCAVVNQCAHDTSRFSLRSINEMRPKAQTVYACLSAVGGWATAVAPKAMPDAAQVPQTASADLDVLANDFDGNCTDVVTVATFPATTANGGTITRLVGAGPSGRDLLRYTAGNTFAGVDVWSYTVSDAGGSTSATVSVTVTAPRAPDYNGPTAPGLNVSYYKVQGASSFPDDYFSLPQFGASWGGTSINYTNVTAGVLGTSFRTDNAGAVCFSGLNVPAAGAYTFYLNSDDGCRLSIDNVPVVNNDFVHTATERTGTITLTAGNHFVGIEYFDATGPSTLVLRWTGPGIPTPTLISGPSRWYDADGVRFTYFDMPPAPASMPNFTGMTAYATSTATQLDFPATAGNFSDSNRPDDVGAVYTGYLSVPSTGLYTFYTESDDGSKLWFGSTLIVNNDGLHPMTEASGQASLIAGKHTFKVEYYSGGGNADGLIVRWQGPGIPKQVIPAVYLKRPGAGCGPADLGMQGGVAGADGQLDNNDFVVFINLFFAGNAGADLGSQGGIAPGDGQFDNNDFVVFINFFFGGC